MKKILITTILLMVMASTNFAQGFTQFDLAELLVNKAKAENIIENKEYSQDEIIDFVKANDLFELTDVESEVTPQTVRSSFSTYEAYKNGVSIGSEVITADENNSTYNKLEDEDRILSNEFMKMTEEERRFTRELGSFALDGKSFPTTDDDEYPLVNKYRYELYRIMGWYAKEYNMYVHQTPASVALYRRESDVQVQNSPIIIVGFSDNPTDDNYDGVAYHVRMKVNTLYNVKYNDGETLAEYRERIVATGFKQAHLVMALKDVSNIFIKDEIELNEFVDSYVADVVENEDKEYSYGKRRHEVFGDTRYYISKIQGQVFYYIDQDLSTWED